MDGGNDQRTRPVQRSGITDFNPQKGVQQEASKLPHKSVQHL